MDKAQRFLTLFAGVGEGDAHIVRQLAAMRLDDLVQHIARRAPA